MSQRRAQRLGRGACGMIGWIGVGLVRVYCRRCRRFQRGCRDRRLRGLRRQCLVLTLSAGFARSRPRDCFMRPRLGGAPTARCSTTSRAATHRRGAGAAALTSSGIPATRIRTARRADCAIPQLRVVASTQRLQAFDRRPGAGVEQRGHDQVRQRRLAPAGSSSVCSMRSRPLSARNSVCTGTINSSQAASALTRSTPSMGGQSSNAKSKRPAS